MLKLFLPQTTLEEWILADKADITDGKLVVKAEKASYPVTPAVHFKAIATGGDAQKLLSKVKTHDALKALGADYMADSVVLGDDAYEVVEGYIADVPAPSAAKPAQATKEADLLAAFLLDKL